MKREVFALFLCLCLFCAAAATYRDAPPTDVPDFKQDDERWAGEMYSSHGDPAQTIGEHGCGICAMADIIAYWFDAGITPVDMARMSEKMGSAAYGGGTYREFFTGICGYYPLTVDVVYSPQKTAEYLEKGGLVIMCYGRHASMIYACTGDDYWLHDSGWGNDLLSRIMGHRNIKELEALDATYYCYQRSDIS